MSGKVYDKPDDLIKELRRQGWETVVARKSTYVQVKSPHTGETVSFSRSKMSMRAWLNVRAMLRREGADL